MSYFIDYPLATKEGGILYRQGIEEKLVKDLVVEKEKIQRDMNIILELASIKNENTPIDAVIDLEILGEDMRDLNNQLNQYQVWFSKHQVEDINTGTVQWANFSGFGISDINFSSFKKQRREIQVLSNNISQIETILKQKEKRLEERINQFDRDLAKIKKEMVVEKIRQTKMEKEK